MAEARVLVTRPQGQADGLCRMLQQAGFETVQRPMMHIEPLAELPAEQLQAVIDLDLYQHLIFVSANAVRFGMEWISSYWPQFPVGVNCYAVGPSSATRLRDWNLEARLPATSMDSEGLLALPELQQVEDQRVLIVKGEGGRDYLRSQLVQRGAHVDTLACYRRSPPQADPSGYGEELVSLNLTAIMVSSGEGLDNMMRLLDEPSRLMLYGVSVIAPGERVGARARDLGFRRVIVAENATDEAMMAALQKNS